VVHAIHPHVVHVEEHAAPGAARDFGHELGFREGGFLEGAVTRDVLDQDAPAEPFLDAGNAFHDVAEGLGREGQRQQVVGVAPAERGPRQVLGDEARLESPGERIEAREVGLVEGIGRAQRQAHAVQAQGIAAAKALQPGERLAAGPKKFSLCTSTRASSGRRSHASR
jgi:hypothetical protein